MAKHVLEGLIKWSTRDPWVDRFEGVLEDHLIPTCEETDLEFEDIASTIGEDLFMNVVWMCAFEDLLTREYDDIGNIVDDYLKRRGWKETPSARDYMTALRNSTMSLYEVSDPVPGKSFRARDLVRGGEPVLISERTASRSLRPWDRIAARVVHVGSQAQISGAVLPFESSTAEAFLDAWRGFGQLSAEEKLRLAEEATGETFDNVGFLDRSPTEILRASSAMFTSFWLSETIDDIEQPDTPDLRNSDGDELVLCTARYPLAAGSTEDGIRAVLEARPEFVAASETSWSWIRVDPPVANEPAQGSLAFESRGDDGSLVLGTLTLEGGSLVLNVNSAKRSELGSSLLSEMLGAQLGRPLIHTESVEQLLASEDPDAPDEPDMPEEERRGAVHGYLDRYYRDVLDQPVPMLGDLSPRAAVATEGGRVKVADWLKMLENRTARSGEFNSAMGSYGFEWMWTELGIEHLRR